MRVDEACKTYLEAKSKRVRVNTLQGYKSAIDAHIIPRWGTYELDSITHNELQAWIDEFSTRGAAEKAFKTFRQVLRYHIAHGLRIWDYTQGIELPMKSNYTPHVLDARELAEFLRGFYGHECEMVILLEATLGLRRGEACAIDLAKDIDYRTGAVHVGKSLQYIAGDVVLLPPKTPKSDRICYLPSFALKRLRQISPRHGQAAQGMSPERIARKIRQHCKRNGLPQVSMTNLRHTWASLAIEAGVPIETVAMMLGHTEIGTAYAHYIVPRKKVCKEAQKAFENLLFR